MYKTSPSSLRDATSPGRRDKLNGIVQINFSENAAAPLALLLGELSAEQTERFENAADPLAPLVEKRARKRLREYKKAQNPAAVGNIPVATGSLC